MKPGNQLTLGFALTLFFASSLYAQQPFIYPGKGQTQEQMEKDKFECYVWAKKNSGYDPMHPPTQQEIEAKIRQQQSQTQASGAGAGGSMARGAVGGAIIGEAVSDDPGKGAAIGLIAGGIRSARRAEQQKQQQEQAIKQQAQAELTRQRDTYNRANAACLEGRGYTVK